MVAWRTLALAVVATGAMTVAAQSQGWSGGGYGGGGYNGAEGDYDDGRGGYDDARRRPPGGYERDGRSQGGQGYGGQQYGGQGYGDPYRSGPRPGWGGGPGGQRWWRGRWWAPGVGACWRRSPWRQNWKWICD
ncbi:hypothetical protein ACNHKD_14590 [Methylocystis sp. JAN1]|uniref:hypothetical protein n=1 Tax=Methylocystis sp. JAN1 TaxID=3397211 RepID=UPI003FA2A8EB